MTVYHSRMLPAGMTEPEKPYLCAVEILFYRYHGDFFVSEHGRVGVERIQHQLAVYVVKVLVCTRRQGCYGSPDVLIALNQR